MIFQEFFTFPEGLKRFVVRLGRGARFLGVYLVRLKEFAARKVLKLVL